MRLTSLKDRSGWPAFAVTTIARSTLGVGVSMLLWSVLPALIGWHPTVVMTGSMLPRLTPGDVVVSRPVDAAALRPGMILLVDDPDHPGRLRLHRFVRTDSDGTLILRGDANRTDDSTPVRTSAVHGVASLRIPDLARPVLWVRDRQFGPLAVSALVLLLLLRLATWWRKTPTPQDPSDPSGDTSGRPSRETRRWLGPRARGTAVAMVAALVVVLSPLGANAATPFRTTRSTPNQTFAAANYFTCRAAVTADSPTLAWKLAESSGTTAADYSGNGNTGTYSGGVGYGASGPCRSDSATAVTLDGTSGTVTGSTTISNQAAISFEVWFKAAAASPGGSLLSIGPSSKQSVVLAMTSTGKIALGAKTGGFESLSTTAAYNDSAWHLAVGVFSTSGMQLYVDAQPALTDTGVTNGNFIGGTLRIGNGDATNVKLTANDYFQGSVGFAAVYGSALTATRIANHYYAAQ